MNPEFGASDPSFLQEPGGRQIDPSSREVPLAQPPPDQSPARQTESGTDQPSAITSPSLPASEEPHPSRQPYSPEDNAWLRYEYEGYTSLDAIPPERRPEMTRWLAQEYQIYTTTEPQDPGDFLEFRKKLETEKALNLLAKNARRSLKNIPGYKDEEKLGHKLADVFGAITDVAVEGVGYDPDPNAGSEVPISGTAVAEKVVYTVPKDAVAPLSRALQGLLKTSLDDAYPIDGNEDNGVYTVTVYNITEYVNRVMGNAIAQLVAEDDEKETKTVLPSGKNSLSKWKKAGHTFHPDVEARLARLDERYQTLGQVEARDFRTEVAHKDLHLLGTDAAPVFQVVRDSFRRIIREKRGGDHYNKEQHPDKKRRLLIEEGVNLTRDVATAEDVKDAPRDPRALDRTEKLKETGREKIKAAKENKLATSLSVVSKAVGTATGSFIESAVDLGLQSIPKLTGAGAGIAADRKEWKRRKIAFKDSREKIARRIAT